jgi:hypothetical protein
MLVDPGKFCDLEETMHMLYDHNNVDGQQLTLAVPSTAKVVQRSSPVKPSFRTAKKEASPAPQ